jgi:hypothetical protein
MLRKGDISETYVQIGENIKMEYTETNFEGLE